MSVRVPYWAFFRVLAMSVLGLGIVVLSIVLGSHVFAGAQELADPTMTLEYSCPSQTKFLGSGESILCRTLDGEDVDRRVAVRFTCPEGQGANAFDDNDSYRNGAIQCVDGLGVGTSGFGLVSLVGCDPDSETVVIGRFIDCVNKTSGEATFPWVTQSCPSEVSRAEFIDGSLRCNALVDPESSAPAPVVDSAGGCPDWVFDGTEVGEVCVAGQRYVEVTVYRCAPGFSATSVGLTLVCVERTPPGTTMTLSLWHFCPGGFTIRPELQLCEAADGYFVEAAMNSFSRTYSCPAGYVVLFAEARCETLELTTPGRRQVELSESASWLETLNWHRAGAGLDPVEANETFSAEIAAHLHYLENTPQQYFVGEYANTHLENPESPFFSQAGRLGGAANFGSVGASDKSAVEGLLTAPFAAMNLLAPTAATAGFHQSNPGGAGLGLRNDPASGAPDPEFRNKIIVFPGAGSTTHLQTSSGTGTPSPLPTCGYTAPTGLPILVVLPGGSAVDPTVAATVTDESGETVESCVVSEHNYVSSDSVHESPEMLSSRIVVMPRDPLTSTRYRVNVTQPGLDISWVFGVTGNGPLPTCQGRLATVMIGIGEKPTRDSDVILGTAGDDVIAGLGGDDIICGGSGDDTITGGEGNDRISGGDGKDRIRGQNGNDIINGGAGNDNLNGNNGDDQVQGGAGQDYVSGRDGRDLVTGGPGNDTINGGGKKDVIRGGDGDDAINGNGFADDISGGRGRDTIHGGDGPDLVRGDQGDDVLTGGRGNDTLWGGSGADTCDGKSGWDSYANCEVNLEAS